MFASGIRVLGRFIQETNIKFRTVKWNIAENCFDPKLGIVEIQSLLNTI